MWCPYYDFGEFSELTKAEALFKAVDDYLTRTNGKYISWTRMSEIAAALIDGLILDGEKEAYRYMVDVAELSKIEAEYFELDMDRYRAVEDEDDADSDTIPSNTGGDYSSANPSDAPGMSASNFI